MTLFAFVLIFSLFSHRYLNNSMLEIQSVLTEAATYGEDGDFLNAREKSEEALFLWNKFKKKSYLIADKTHLADITAALSRLTELSRLIEFDNRAFSSDCAYILSFIEHMVTDN